jgi:hypothetical protein
MAFIQELRFRNEHLYLFGLICFAFSMLFLMMTQFTNITVMGVNAWYKPFKFAFSTFLYAWAIAWYCAYLPSLNLKLTNWIIISMLGFEIIYIAIQAARGQLSHFNLSTPMYAALYSCMAAAASIVTIWTAYIGYLFFSEKITEIPDYYLWSIRLGIFIFVIFSFQGFLMGSRMTHTIGGQDGGPGIPVLNWSSKYGDPRIAHFIGMHALQVLPIISFYLLKNIKATIILGLLYVILAIFTLIQALQGKPLFKM